MTHRLRRIAKLDWIISGLYLVAAVAVLVTASPKR